LHSEINRYSEHWSETFITNHGNRQGKKVTNVEQG
jgi:hypothetical protein